MILFDTGPIVASAVTKDRHSRGCVDLLTDLLTGLRLAKRELLLPATVTAEVGYLLDSYSGPAAEARFLQGVADGDFEPVHLTDEDYFRMSELVEQYADLPLGTTDVSVVAIAERLGIEEIATLDRRHFTVSDPGTSTRSLFCRRPAITLRVVTSASPRPGSQAQ